MSRGRMTARRGFTLIDQLVVAGLLALLLTLTAQVLAPCLSVWQRSRTRSDLDQSARMLEYRLAEELRRSTAESVTVLAGELPAISFLSTRPASGTSYDGVTGRPIWTRVVAYYLDAPNRVLYRKEWPNPRLGISQVPALPYTLPTTTPLRLSEAELALLCTTANHTEQRASYHVSELSATVPSYGRLDVDLRLLTESRSGPESLLRSVVLRMRN